MTTEAYSEIGNLLRSARLQMRMPLDEASHLLHIRVRYLEALEEGRLHELPGLTYTRGYLQAYAGLLELDRDEILRRFEQIEEVLARKGFYFPQVFSKDKAPSPLMVWGGLVSAIIIYLIWAVFLHSSSPPVSMVEKLPPPESKLPHNVPCLQPPDVLYPPCTMAAMPVAPHIMRALLPREGKP